MWRWLVVLAACGRIGFGAYDGRSVDADPSGLSGDSGAASDSLLGDGAVAVAMDVTSSTSTSQTGFARNTMTGLWVTTVTVTNTSSAAIEGPVSFVCDDLGSNATMYQPTGYTARTNPTGSPYLDIGGTVAAGSAAMASLQFMNPSNGLISYTPRILAGPGARSQVPSIVTLEPI